MTTVNRRGFLGALLAAPVVAALAPLLARGDSPEPAPFSEWKDDGTDYYYTTGLVNSHFIVTYPASWTSNGYLRIVTDDLEPA